MTELVVYEVIGYTEPHHFTLGEKEFVYVSQLLIEDANGNVIEKNLEVYTKDDWEDIKNTLVYVQKENVAKNIMVGDYYN